MAGKIIDALSDFVTDFDYIVFGLIFLLYIGLNSQIFYDKILDKFDGALNMGMPSNYGIIIQALIMALVSILIYKMYENEII